MQVTNTTAGGLGLPDGPVVPGKGSVDVPDAVWAKAKDHPVVAGWLDEKKLTTSKVDRKAPAPSYEARAAEGGTFAVFNGDEKVADLKSQADVDEFNKLSDADKAKLVKKG